MTENELQDAVIEAAGVFGWQVAHFRPARTEKGWRTAVAAQGKGFPDLTMARPERLIFAEIKSAKGRLTPEQKAWLEVLEDTDAEVYVWKPDQWKSGEIEEALR